MEKNAGRIIISGASGSGKSTRTKELLQDRPRVVVFDPIGEYATVLTTSLRILRDRLAGRWSRDFRVSYIPPAGREPEFLHHLARVLIAAQRPYFEGRDDRILTLVVEEMNLSYPVAALPRELDGMPELCSRGRHHGIELIGVTQRLAEVSTRFRGNTSEAYYFRQADHSDLTTAARILGPELKDTLKALPKYHYLRFAGGQVEPGETAGAA